MCFPGKRDDFVCHYIYFGPGFLCLSFSLYPLVSGGVVLPLVFSFFAYTLTFTSAKGTKKGLGHSPPTEFRAVGAFKMQKAPTDGKSVGAIKKKAPLEKKC